MRTRLSINLLVIDRVDGTIQVIVIRNCQVYNFAISTTHQDSWFDSQCLDMYNIYGKTREHHPRLDNHYCIHIVSHLFSSNPSPYMMPCI
jgi:hypothetical protein